MRRESRPDASPLTNRSVNAQSSNLANGLRKSKGNTKVPEPAPSVNFSDSDDESQVNGDENADSFEQIQPEYDADDFAGDDDTVMSHQAAQLDESDHNDADLDGVSIMAPEPPPEPPRRPEQPNATSKAKAPASRNISRVEDTTHHDEINGQEPAPKAKRTGRPTKAQRKANEDAEEQRPPKKAKTSAGQTSREVEATGNPEIDNIVEDYASRKGGSKARSLHVLKREKPADSATTRSGRRVVKPLASWKNEKCLFGDEGISEGRWIPCSTMTGVLRAEESDSEYKKSKKGRGRASKKSKTKSAESDDDDEDVDAWEQEGGVLHGYIRKWDAEVQAGVDEEEVLGKLCLHFGSRIWHTLTLDVDIAYAPSGIETKDVKDSTFRFAKLLSSPFLGSGIVELPPGGVKRPKNSKKMHMVFYVCQGRVQIDISGVQFSAGKGCVFQVPRGEFHKTVPFGSLEGLSVSPLTILSGNYYSFANAHGRNVRLFFTQGCVPENGSPAPDDLKQTPIEGDSATEAGQTGPRTKGRPKGSKGAKAKDKGPKQKAGTKA